MACLFPNDAARSAYIRRIVRESIAEVDEGDPTITQQTLLGPSGLGHGAALRRKYYGAIQRRLENRGCTLVGLSPESFVAATVRLVADVTKLVSDNLG